MGQRARIARQSSSPPMPGQHHVEHDEMRRLALDERGHLAAVAGRDDAEAVAGEVLPDDVPDGGLVVDDEHGARRLHTAIVAARTLRSGEFAGRPRARS